MALAVTVNGTEIGHDPPANMGWPFEDLVTFAPCGTLVHLGGVLL